MEFCPRVFWPPVNAIAEEVSKFANTAMETRHVGRAVKPSNTTKLLFSYCWIPSTLNKKSFSIHTDWERLYK